MCSRPVLAGFGLHAWFLQLPVHLSHPANAEGTCASASLEMRAPTWPQISVARELRSRGRGQAANKMQEYDEGWGGVLCWRKGDQVLL